MSEYPPKKRYGFYVLAILLLISSGVALFIGYGHHNVILRFYVNIAAIVGVYLVKISNVHNPAAMTFSTGREAESKAANRPGPMMWIAGIALLGMVGVCFFFLYRDAVGGWHERRLEYLLAGSSVVCASFWAYLVSRLR